MHSSSVPSLKAHLVWGRNGRVNGCRYFGRKENTQKKSSDMGKKREWKNTKICKVMEKRRWTPTGYAQDTIASPKPGNSPSEEVRVIGHQRTVCPGIRTEQNYKL